MDSEQLKNSHIPKALYEEIKKRLSKLPEFEPKIKTGYLRRYSYLVTSANTGAVFRKEF